MEIVPGRILAPVAIIAEALGYHPKTIETHATASGADYARYVGAIVDSRGSTGAGDVCS